MKTCVYNCDKCGKEIKNGHYLVTFAGINVYYDFDLCPDCAELLILDLCKRDPERIRYEKVMSEYGIKPQNEGQIPEINGKVLEEVTEEGVKEKPPDKKIDYGKALALHNAGWNSYQIAEEMRISVQEAARAVEKAKSQVFS